MRKNKRSLSDNLKMIFRGYKIVFGIFPKFMIWTIIYSITNSITPYFALYMSSLVINELAYSRDIKNLIKLAAIAVLGIFTLSVVIRLIKGRVNVYGSDSWRQDSLFYLKTQNRMKYECLDNPDVTNLREKIQAAKTATGGGLQQLYWSVDGFFSSIANVVFSVGLTVSLFSIKTTTGDDKLLNLFNAPYFTILLIIVIIITAIVNVIASNKEARKVTDAHKDLANYNQKYRTLNVWGTDAYIFNMHKVIIREMKNIIIKPSFAERSKKYEIKYGLTRTIINSITTILIYLYIAARVFAGYLGIGNLVLYTGTVGKFISSLCDLVTIVGVLIQNNDYLVYLFDFLSLPNDDIKNEFCGVIGSASIQHEIEFCDVSFKYPRCENWALRHVSAKIKFGDHIAIVGMNGGGKTTFIKLMCRLYSPTEGKILLDGIDISEYNFKDYMSIISVVFQDYKIFSFDIASNISASHDYNEKRIKSCLELVGLKDKVMNLKRGIETPLHRDYENDGIDISGGEEQKIAIARSMYKDSQFFILDEPTAALDPIAESEIYNQLNNIIENKTAIYISHRLSSCKFCDKIFVFEKGEIIQTGSHTELLRDIKGKYYELWNAQAKYYNN